MILEALVRIEVIVMTLSYSGVVTREVTYVISWSVYQVDLSNSSPTASL